MEIQWVEKTARGTGRVPKFWAKEPCISVGKSWINISPPACKAFGVKDGTMLCCGFTETQLIFKIAEDSTEVANAFVVKKNALTGRLTPCRVIRQLHDRGCLGLCFVLKLNGTQRLLIADITEPIKD